MPYNKADQAAYFRKWRKGDGREKFNEGKKRYRESIKKLILDIKSSSCCKICNSSHPAIITFHHRDPSQKRFNVGDASVLSMGKKSILAEIAKCDTLCHNCHAMVHWEERDVG